MGLSGRGYECRAMRQMGSRIGGAPALPESPFFSHLVYYEHYAFHVIHGEGMNFGQSLHGLENMNSVERVVPKGHIWGANHAIFGLPGDGVPTQVNVGGGTPDFHVYDDDGNPMGDRHESAVRSACPPSRPSIGGADGENGATDGWRSLFGVPRTGKKESSADDEFSIFGGRSIVYLA